MRKTHYGFLLKTKKNGFPFLFTNCLWPLKPSHFLSQFSSLMIPFSV